MKDEIKKILEIVDSCNPDIRNQIDDVLVEEIYINAIRLLVEV